jgi:hypothetical protein
VPPVLGRHAAGKAGWQAGRRVWVLLLPLAVGGWLRVGAVWGGWLRLRQPVRAGMLLLLLAPLVPSPVLPSLAQIPPLRVSL